MNKLVIFGSGGHAKIFSEIIKLKNLNYSVLLMILKKRRVVVSILIKKIL